MPETNLNERPRTQEERRQHRRAYMTEYMRAYRREHADRVLQWRKNAAAKLLGLQQDAGSIPEGGIKL